MNNMTDRSKRIMLLVVILATVLYFINKCSTTDPVHNDGSLETILENTSEDIAQIDSEQVIMVNPEDERLKNKMKSRNSSTSDYKSSNYKMGKRGNGSNLDHFFNDNGPFASNAGSSYSGVDNNQNQYASFNSSGNGKLSEEDKFDADKLLPQEKNNDWFNDPHESTSVKSSHLINIYRPVAVNTVQVSRKNATHDIRGEPANPKLPVSPWQNSSYQPDTNIRSGGLC
jgi:hypothetical protein